MQRLLLHARQHARRRQIHKWAEKLGLAGKSGIDLPNEIESIVPSTEWKRQRTGEKWYAGETISVAIGQGQLSVTPMSLAVMMATVANGGTRVVPRLVKAVDEAGRGLAAGAAAGQPVHAVPDEARDGLRGARRPVDGGQRRRARPARARIAGRDVAGKTGTAQVISNQGKERARGATDKDLRDHGWFVFLAPQRQPRDRRRRLRRARRARLPGRADRQARHRDLLRAEGRPAAAGAERCRRPPTPAPAPVPAAPLRTAASTAGPSADVRAPPLLPHRLAADRRGARALRDRPGDDLQRHRRRRPHLLDADLRARPRRRRDGRVPGHRLPLARRQVAPDLPGDGAGAGRRAVLRRGARRLAPLDRSRRPSTCSRRSSPRPPWR